MKPHIMFFDEYYSEELYRLKTVTDFLENKLDGLIVVGTTLETTLANQILRKALNKPKTVTVEVNTSP